MNVLLSAYACMPDSGSEPGNGWNWALHLADRGIHVTVLTREESRPRIEAYLQDHPVANLDVAYVAVPGSAFKPASGMHYALWQICAVPVAKALHRTQPFDVVHHVTYTSIHLPTRLWLLGLPTVFGPVGGGQTAPESMLPYFGANQASEKRRTLLTRALRYSPLHRRWLGKMDVVLAANSDTLELMRALGRPDARLQFDNGVTPDYLAAEPRTFVTGASPLRLLWVGRLLPRKALPLALDALTQVTCPVTLTIVGDGLPENQVRRMISDRNLTGKVYWAGRRLTWREVRTAYNDHDVLLFTSVRETSGVQLLEAMAMALPVITLDLHGARDVVPQAAGFKVPVTTPARVVHELAAAIDRFAALPPEQKNSMSRASLAFARESTWPFRAEGAEALYLELLAWKHRQPPS